MWQDHIVGAINLPVLTNEQRVQVTIAQCAVWVVRWPCGISAIAVKNTFSWENNMFEAIFPRFFWEENLKTCFAFHLPALQTLF